MNKFTTFYAYFTTSCQIACMDAFFVCIVSFGSFLGSFLGSAVGGAVGAGVGGLTGSFLIMTSLAGSECATWTVLCAGLGGFLGGILGTKLSPFMGIELGAAVGAGIVSVVVAFLGFLMLVAANYQIDNVVPRTPEMVESFHKCEHLIPAQRLLEYCLSWRQDGPEISGSLTELLTISEDAYWREWDGVMFHNALAWLKNSLQGRPKSRY